MCEIMAEQDIREDQMTITNTVDYLRGLKGKDSVLIAPGNLLSALFHLMLATIQLIVAQFLIFLTQDMVFWWYLKLLTILFSYIYMVMV